MSSPFRFNRFNVMNAKLGYVMIVILSVKPPTICNVAIKAEPQLNAQQITMNDFTLSFFSYRAYLIFIFLISIYIKHA